MSNLPSLKNRVRTLLLFLVAHSALAAPVTELEEAYQKKNWPLVAEKAHEWLKVDSAAVQPRLRGAEAIQQMGYPIAALLFLKGVTKEAWKNSAGKELFTQNLIRYQNSVPATVLAPNLAVNGDTELAIWIQAHAAFNLKDNEQAKNLLHRIGDHSELAAGAHYLLGVLALETDAKTAATEFEKACLLSANAGPGCLARARMAYATHDDKAALDQYGNILKSSPHFAESQLEKAWTELRTGQKATPQELPNSLDALNLTAANQLQNQQAESAQSTLNKLLRKHAEAVSHLQSALRSPANENAPVGYENEIENETAWHLNHVFLKNLDKELEGLGQRADEAHPLYVFLVRSLTPLRADYANRLDLLTKEFSQNKIDHLEKTYVRAQLLLAETYLSEKESNHLLALEKSAQVLEETSKQVQHFYPPLSLRTSELLWELGKAKERAYQENKNNDDRERAALLKQRSLEFVDTLMSQVSQFPKYDRALFFAGYVELEMGKEEAGLAHLKQYLSSFPQEAAVPEAHRILADYHFNKNQYAEAASEYHRILTTSNTPLAGYAHYKLGWCAYYGGNSNLALQELESVVNWTNQWDKSDDVLNLEKQAKHDLISIYAEGNDFHEAATFFNRFLGPESLQGLNQLGEHLEQTGQSDKAAELYRSLIQAYPDGPQNLTYRIRILKALYQARDWKNIPAAAHDLVEGNRGIFKNSTDPNSQQAETILRTVVLADVQQLPDNAPTADLQRPLQLDDIYLSAFSDWPSAQKPLFEKGRLLVRLKQWERAAPVLREHWNRFSENLEAEPRELALRSLIHCLQQLETQNPSKPGAPNGIGLEILQLADSYQSAYPNSKYCREIAFFASTLWFHFDDLAKGTAASQKIFDSNPRDEFGKKAFDNLRVAYYQGKNWEKIYRWSSEMESRKLPGMESYQEPLNTIRGESLFMWADGTSDNHRSAELFLKLGTDPELNEYWIRALYNGFIRLRAAGEKQAALKVAVRLETLAPDSEWVRNIAPARAEIYEAAGDYESALPYLNYSVFNPPKELSAEARAVLKLKLALTLEAIGRGRSALPLLKELAANTNPTASGRGEAELALNRLNDAARAPSSIESHWTNLSEKFLSFERYPLPVQGTPEKRVKSGAEQLQKLATETISIANDPKVSADLALEAYCAIPFLYHSYQEGINRLGSVLDGQAQERMTRMANAIEIKTKEFANQCLSKSNLAEHDGAYFRRVNERWGWAFDPILTDRTAHLIQTLETVYPALDSLPQKPNELQIIDDHLSNHETPNSWYALASLRCSGKTDPLCRLTLGQALGKYPNYGPLLNSMGLLEERSNAHSKISSLFQRAAHAGSNRAFGNLALFHLKSGRLKPGLEALKSGLEAGNFDDNDNLKTSVQEWIKVK